MRIRRLVLVLAVTAVTAAGLPACDPAGTSESASQGTSQGSGQRADRGTGHGTGERSEQSTGPHPRPKTETKPGPASRPSRYVRAVLRDRPTALLQRRRDLTGRGHRGSVVGRPRPTRLPNGDPALRFNGRNQYLRFASRAAFKIPATGVLTVEFWMRPDTLRFPNTEGGNYVYVLGKGAPGHHEWYTRMHSRANPRKPNRVSGYSFNPRGGLGAGSYFQDRVRAGRWIHVVFVVNTRYSSRRFPSGYTRIYKNGVRRDTDSLREYGIVPRSGRAPLRIGTGYRDSFFKGAIGDVAFYKRVLRPARIRAHHRIMR